MSDGSFQPYAMFGYKGAQGRPVETRFRSGMVQSIALDDERRPESYLFQGVTGSTGEGQTFRGFDYSYDSANLLVGENFRHKGDTGNWYAYDDDYRLTGVYERVANPHTVTTTPGTYKRKTIYEYDDAGNRLSVVESSSASTFNTFDYDDHLSTTDTELHRYGDLNYDNIHADDESFRIGHDDGHQVTDLGGFDTDDLDPQAYDITYNCYGQIVKIETDASDLLYEARYNALGLLAWERYDTLSSTPTYWYCYGPVGIGAGFACADEIHRYVTSDTLTHITILGPSRSAVSGNPTPLVTLTIDENDLDGDSDETEFQVLEHLVDRLGSNVALSWGDMGPGGAGSFGGPFIVESTEYFQGYGNTAYNDIVLSGYIYDVPSASTVEVRVFTGAVPSANALADCEFIGNAGNGDTSVRVTANSWSSPTLTLTVTSTGGLSKGDYFEIWAPTYDVSSVSTSGGRTDVDFSGSPGFTSGEHVGKYATSLKDGAEPSTTFVIAGNDSDKFTIEALNSGWTSSDRVRLYRRDSKFGIPYGWAGYWNIGRNVEYATDTWSALPPLYYVWNRHYHTQLGRWLTPDPIGHWGDPNQRGNPYQYCGSNPVHGFDPLGLYDPDQEAYERNERRFAKYQRPDKPTSEWTPEELFEWLEWDTWQKEKQRMAPALPMREHRPEQPRAPDTPDESFLGRAGSSLLGWCDEMIEAYTAGSVVWWIWHLANGWEEGMCPFGRLTNNMNNPNYQKGRFIGGLTALAQAIASGIAGIRWLIVRGLRLLRSPRGLPPKPPAPTKGVAPTKPQPPGGLSSGTANAPRTGAPNSVYVKTSGNGTVPVRSTIYDGQGRQIGHIDWQPRGGVPHGHKFPPGEPGAGHGPGSEHIPLADLPEWWKALPDGLSGNPTPN